MDYRRDPTSDPGPDHDVLGGGADRPRPRAGLRRGLLAVLLAVAAFAYGPDLLASSGLSRLLAAGPQPSASRPPSPSAGLPTPTPTTSASPATASGPMSWAARGNLAGDASFAGEVRRALDPSVRSSAHPIWAGAVANGRLALVAVPASYPGGVEVLALRFGDRDFGIDPEPVPATDNSTGDGPPTLFGWLGPREGGTRPMLLLGPPELGHFHLSDDLEFRTDGTAGRRWRRVEAAGGQAWVALREGLVGPVIVRARAAAGAGQPLVVEEYADRARPPVRIAGLGGRSYRGPAPHLVDVSGLASSVGGAKRASVIWSGDVGGTYRGVVVSLVSRSGATFDYWQVSGPAGFDSLVGGVFLVPRDEARTYPVPILLPGADGGPGEHWLVISPGGGSRVEVVENERVIARLPLDERGVAVVPARVELQPSRQLVVRGKDGNVVGTASLERILGFDLWQAAATPG